MGAQFNAKLQRLMVDWRMAAATEETLFPLAAYLEKRWTQAIAAGDLEAAEGLSSGADAVNAK